jgi:hypothetical protein
MTLWEWRRHGKVGGVEPPGRKIKTCVIDRLGAASSLSSAVRNQQRNGERGPAIRTLCCWPFALPFRAGRILRSYGIVYQIDGCVAAESRGRTRSRRSTPLARFSWPAEARQLPGPTTCVQPAPASAPASPASNKGVADGTRDTTNGHSSSPLPLSPSRQGKASAAPSPAVRRSLGRRPRTGGEIHLARATTVFISRPPARSACLLTYRPKIRIPKIPMPPASYGPDHGALYLQQNSGLADETAVASDSGYFPYPSWGAETLPPIATPLSPGGADQLDIKLSMAAPWLCTIPLSDFLKSRPLP